MLWALATAAPAEVYECQTDTGERRFQDAPCPGQGKATDIQTHQPRPATKGAGLAPGTYGLSERHAARVNAGVKARTRAGRHLKARVERRRAIERAIRGQRVIPGMTRGEARQAWGPPSTIRKSRAGERWLYRRNQRSQGHIRFDRQGRVSGAHRPSR